MDTSMMMSLLMPDEKRDNQVIKIIKKVETGVYRVFCPVLIGYEVGNSLVQAMRGGRLENKGLGVLWNNYEQINKKIVENDWKAVLELATDSGLTYYDAAFLEVALRCKAKLLTLDVKLDKAYAKYGGRE